MFVVTIGPIGKNWGKVLKLAAIGLVLLLIVIIAWRIVGTMTDGAEQSATPEIITETMSQIGGEGALGFWQRWLGSLKLWFKFGF